MWNMMSNKPKLKFCCEYMMLVTVYGQFFSRAMKTFCGIRGCKDIIVLIYNSNETGK